MTNKTLINWIGWSIILLLSAIIMVIVFRYISTMIAEAKTIIELRFVSYLKGVMYNAFR